MGIWQPSQKFSSLKLRVRFTGPSTCHPPKEGSIARLPSFHPHNNKRGKQTKLLFCSSLKRGSRLCNNPSHPRGGKSVSCFLCHPQRGAQIFRCCYRHPWSNPEVLVDFGPGGSSPSFPSPVDWQGARMFAAELLRKLLSSPVKGGGVKGSSSESAATPKSCHPWDKCQGIED